VTDFFSVVAFAVPPPSEDPELGLPPSELEPVSDLTGVFALLEEPEASLLDVPSLVLDEVSFLAEP
jgi:hypothetical protein